MDWSNEKTLKFLKLYERESAIWDPKDLNHKNRTAVHEAWIRIQKAFASENSECTVNDLKKKKESLMATFRPLLRKSRSGTAPGSWFAFDLMRRFLGNVYVPKPTARTSNSDGQINKNVDPLLEGHENEESSSRASEGEASNDEHTKNHHHHQTAPVNAIITKENSSSSHQAKKRKTTIAPSNIIDSQELIKDTAHIIANNSTSINTGKDECVMYTELLAEKLRKFDEATRAILMHDIDNLVFQARIKQFSSVSGYVDVNPHRVGRFQRDLVEDESSYEQFMPGTSGEVHLQQQEGGEYSIQPSPAGWSEYSHCSSGDEGKAGIVIQ